MLHTPHFHAGAQALLGGDLVTIRQLIGADAALVFGSRLTRRVSLADLAPPPEKSLFERWLAECVLPAPLGDVFTPVGEVADSYRDFLEHEAAAADVYPATDFAFRQMMYRAGHKTELRSWRAPFERQARQRSVYPFALRSPAR
jgi:hypothetical protein